ncbi:MAG: ABC transporter ATP-binding protein/permease [Lachnospiraceae bacterium]|nr:ABC transporter ATP-binding protein/permease [Lachnospiraceae bacterium]
MKLSDLSKKSKALLVLACLFYSAYAATGTVEYYWLSEGVNAAIAGDSGQFLRYSGYAVGMTLASFVLIFIAILMRNLYMADGVLTVKDAMIRNILKRSMAAFREKNNAYWMNLFTTDTEMYRLDYLNKFPFIAFSAVMFFSAFVVLMTLSPLLAWTTLLFALLPFAISRFFTGIIQKRRKVYSEASEGQVGILKENLEGYETIRADGSWRAFHDRFHRASSEKYRGLTRLNFVRDIGSKSSWDILLMIQCVGKALAVLLVIQGRLSAGMLLAVSGYVSSISNGAGNLIEYAMGIRSTKELRDKLKAESSADCEEVTTDFHDAPAAIDYENVSFSFGERRLYDNMSFRFQPGGCYVIVGESGSGKSTLTKLLLKYYDDYTGTIRLAGKDIRSLSEPDIYQMVSVVNQSPYLFNVSLYENITMFGAKPGRDSGEYRALLESLNLTELAERVGDEPLGDFGDKISGGERQRINIARSLRHHPAIMIFDEPTTGLDPENVHMINEFIFSRTDMTRIVISHDWSEDYLGRFDQVIAVGQG